MKRVVTVTMNPACDMIVELTDFMPFEVNKARGGQTFCGGKGVNVSLVLSLLGVENTACGFLGVENADLFKTFCQKHGIGFGFDMLPGATRTNVKLAVDGHPATDINLPGLPIEAERQEIFNKRLVSLADSETVFVLSGSLPPGVDAGIYAALVRTLRSAGAEVMLDASGDALAKGLRAGPNLAKPNREELLGLCGGGSDVVREARRHIAAGVGELAVSLGADGAMLVSEKACLKAAPGKVAAINMVGAGDTFLAGMLYGGLRGWDARTRLAFATALSAHWVEKMDRTVLDRARVDCLAKDISVVEM